MLHDNDNGHTMPRKLIIQREAVVSAIRRARRDHAEYEARTLENVVYLLDKLREDLTLTDKKTLN